MSNPWGKLGSSVGSWAAEAEREEAELRENPPAATTTTSTNPQLFPSLKEAVTTKPKKKKVMSLSEFVSTPGSTRLTHDEMLHLPTAPKQRDPLDYSSSGPRLGGGFSNYGGGGGDFDRRPPPRRGFDDDRRQKRGDFDGNESNMRMPPPPSRADEVDNWASAKRPVMGPDSSRSGSGGGGRYGQLGGGSRADDVDNWNFGKKSQVQYVGGGGGGGGGGRSGGFGSGFRDSGSDWRRGGGVGGGGGEGGEIGSEGGERRRLVLAPPSERNGDEVVVEKAEVKANPFGVARPREEVLSEKGLDWKKMELEIEAKKVVVVGGSSSGSRPTSSQGSRPTSSQSNRGPEGLGGGGGGNVEVKARPKVNPFGDAKPREVLLEEKGLDWRKIDLDLEHRRIDRIETEEEKALKEEIENLRKELENSGDDVSYEYEGQQVSLRDLLQSKEKELDALTRDLDDKVRFGQKAVEKPNSRPSSGAGRFTSFPERPPSQSGSFDDVRSLEVMDRPRSRGTGDVWTRPGEDRRGSFQGSRDRGGFQGSRDRGGFQGSRDRGGYQGSRDGGGYLGSRDGGGYQGSRDSGGYQGSRDRGGFQGSRDRGGFQGGREGFLGNREFDRSRAGERW